MAAARPDPVRVPPHDLQAESSLLGSILLRPEVLDDLAASGLLEAEDFYREGNAEIYRATLRLHHRREPIDNVTLAAELEKVGVLERVGGRAQLALLQTSVPAAANAEYYAELVRGHSVRRQLIRAGLETVRLGHDLSVEPLDAVDQAAALLHRVSGSRADGAALAHTLLPDAVQRLERRQQADEGITGVRSGLQALDRVTGGWQQGQLVLIAARPSIGKSALAINLAWQAAGEQKVPAAIFSLEMPKPVVVDRLLCGVAGIDYRRHRLGRLEPAERERLTEAIARVGDAPIAIDDRSRLDVLALTAEARRLSRGMGLGLLVVDYLQLLEPGLQRGPTNRTQEVTVISRALKALARELDIPVIVASQLHRGPELRADKRPVLADLRDSGSLEQDADVVILLYRDDYYQRERSPRPGVVEFDVAKHREGPVARVEARFLRDQGRFRDLPEQAAHPGQSPVRGAADLRDQVLRHARGRSGEVPPAAASRHYPRPPELGR